MPQRTSHTGTELFIVDNSNEDYQALRYLRDWCGIAGKLDIATGYFDIGALLALTDQWQQVDSIRILMGNEVSLSTKKAFEMAMGEVQTRLDQSLESKKNEDPFLSGVDLIVEALRNRKIQCRVHRVKGKKFHAKAYITHARTDVIDGHALVGSSNFTYAGLTQNLELNVRVTGDKVKVLQEWYEEHWEEAEEVTPEILKVIEPHVRAYTPFEIWAKALYELHASRSMTASEWEEQGSKVFPKLRGLPAVRHLSCCRRCRWQSCVHPAVRRL